MSSTPSSRVTIYLTHHAIYANMAVVIKYGKQPRTLVEAIRYFSDRRSA